MKGFIDIFEVNEMFAYLVETDTKTRFANALSKYLESHNIGLEEFIWLNAEELMEIPGIGIKGVTELQRVQSYIFANA